MAVVNLVKSIYTATDVTSLGEIASGDTVNLPSGSTINSVAIADTAIVSDTAYGSGWNGVTTIAPSKNAVYDEIELRAPKASPTFSGNVTVVETTDTVYDITDGAAFEIDPGNGNIQTITLGASRTPKATNFAAGQCVLLGINDGTAYTITWTDGTLSPTWVSSAGGASAPTLATTGYTWVLLWKVSTTIYGALVGKP